MVSDEELYTPKEVYRMVMGEYGDELKALCGDAHFVDELDADTCKRLNEICDEIFDIYKSELGCKRSDVWWAYWRPDFNDSLEIRDYMTIYKKAWSEFDI
ncbi:MAG: hypothetical protein IKZ14_00655 [Muribaculaceae bacterium]|nr:hypothetical protein [Muribaculaceae bacterium]